MADHDPMQPVGGSPLAPSAPLSPQDIAELPAKLRSIKGDHGTVRATCDAADAIEALTAKNQRLTDALNQTVQEATTAIDDDLKPRIEALTAENARLTDLARTVSAIGDWVCAVDRDRFEDPLCPMDGRTGYVRLDQVRRIRDEARKVLGMDVGWSIEDAVQAMQELADFGQRHQPECYATTDHDWYATQRAKVEVDHAATKEHDHLALLRAIYPPPRLEEAEADKDGD